MSTKTILMDDQLLEYLRQNSVREPDVLQELREETQKLSNSGMQISPEQGQLMAMLVKLVNARKIVEIGTFTGYSSTVMALAMPEDSQLIDLTSVKNTLAQLVYFGRKPAWISGSNWFWGMPRRA